MNIWIKIFHAIWKKRPVEPAPEEPSRAQLDKAHDILSFAGSAQWPAYEEHLCTALGEAMEAAFVAAKMGNTNLAMSNLLQARANYVLLTEPQQAQAIVKKSNQVIIRPTTTRRNSE